MKKKKMLKIRIEDLNSSFINKIANVEFGKLSKNTLKRIIVMAMILKLKQLNKDSLTEKELTDAVQEFTILCGLEAVARKGILKGKGYGFDRKYIKNKSFKGDVKWQKNVNTIGLMHQEY